MASSQLFHNVLILLAFLCTQQVRGQYHTQPCRDICGCVSPMVTRLGGDSGIVFKIEGNRFHLQKVLHESTSSGVCHSNVTAPPDGVYLECVRGSELHCASSELMADFSLEYGDQPRDVTTRDYMNCWLEDGVTRCIYLNATRDERWDDMTYMCKYKKPKKYCEDNFSHYKGLCLSNWTISSNPGVTCDDMGAEIIGTSKRELAYINETKYRKQVWVKNGQAANNAGNCTSTNADGSEALINTHCGGKLYLACKTIAFKELNCSTSPIDLTTESPTTDLGVTTAQDNSKKVGAATPVYKIETAEERLRNNLNQVQNEIAEYFHEMDVEVPVMQEQTKDVVIVEAIDSFIDNLVASISQSNESARPLTIKTSSLVVMVVPLNEDIEGEIGGAINNQTFSVGLPATLKQTGVTLAMSGTDIGDNSNYHVEMEESPSTLDEQDTNEQPAEVFIGSLITTISIGSKGGGLLGEQLDQPLNISFTTSERPDSISGEATLVPSCRFWKPSESGGGVWSSEGCRVADTNFTHTRCECTHLTSFAVLMSVGPSETLSDSDVIHYMTLIGCSLSIFCLGMMILIFIAKKLFRADRNAIHMNLALSLMLGQLVFLVAIERTEEKIICQAIGMALHFFFLGTFFWMLNEGIYLVSKTRSQKSKFLKMPIFMVIGWVGPLIAVGLTAGLWLDAYETENQCWLSVENGGIWTFVGPAVAIIIANVVMLSNVIRVFLSLRANMKKKQVERTWLALRAMLLTLPLLGLTWMFGLLTSIHSTTVVFQYLFVICNSLQGVFIFVLYCLLNDEVRRSVLNLSNRSSLCRSKNFAEKGLQAGFHVPELRGSHQQDNRMSILRVFRQSWAPTKSTAGSSA